MKRILVFSLLWLVSSWQAAWAFYCGQYLVTEGDYMYQVLQKCGEPDFWDSRVEYRSVVIRSPYNKPGMDLIREEPVNIEEWTYDFGPHRFVQWLYFENGRLLLIKDLGYGRLYNRR